MDKNRLVQIFVPTTDPEGKGSIGTGYPVAKDRILTAHHVVFPENRDDSKPIEIRWYHLDESQRGWRTISRMVWDSQKEDVAVLECPFPIEITPFAELDSRKPETAKRWESEGFAKAGKRDDKSNPPVGLQGNTYSMGGHGVFELGVDDPANSPDLWQGASGSPVFVAGRIQGVIVTTPTSFPANRFAAAPMWRLLQDPAFRNAVNFQPKPLLKRDPWFLSSLVKSENQHSQIKRLLTQFEMDNPGKAIACLFADFTVECPDTLAFKLLHQIQSASDGQKQVSISVEYQRGRKPDEWLWDVLKDTLHADAPTVPAIQRALRDYYQEPTVFVLDLAQGHVDNRPFIAGLIHAWQSLQLDDHCHCLVLLQGKPENPSLWRRWGLARWAKAMGKFLGEARHHLICPDASPAIHPAHGKAWIKEIAKHDYSKTQTSELQFRWQQHFKPNKPLCYEAIRLKLKADLIAVKA